MDVRCFYKSVYMTSMPMDRILDTEPRYAYVRVYVGQNLQTRAFVYMGIMFLLFIYLFLRERN